MTFIASRMVHKEMRVQTESKEIADLATRFCAFGEVYKNTKRKQNDKYTASQMVSSIADTLV